MAIITCTCGKTFAAGDPSLGKKPRCPECGARIGDSDPLQAKERPQPKDRPAADDDDDRAPQLKERSGKKKRKKAAASSGGKIWLFAAGGAGVVALIVVAIVLAMGGGDNPPDSSKGKEKPPVEEPKIEEVTPEAKPETPQPMPVAPMPMPNPAEAKPEPPPVKPVVPVQNPEFGPADGPPLLDARSAFGVGKDRVTLLGFASTGATAVAVTRPPPPERPINMPGVTIVAGDRLFVWDLDSGKQLPIAPENFTFEVKGANPYFGAAGFLPGDKQLVGLLGGGDVLIYDIGGAKKPRTLKLAGPVTDNESFPHVLDGRQLLVPDGLTGFQIFDPTVAGKTSAPFLGHVQHVTGLALTPDKKHVLSGGYDQTIRLWDAKTGKELRRYDHDAGCRHVAALGDNKHAVVVWDDGTVALWDIEEWQAVRTAPATAALSERAVVEDQRRARLATHPARFTSVAAVPGPAPRVLFGCEDGSIRLWDVEKDREAIFLPRPAAAAPMFGAVISTVRPVVQIQALAVAPDGRQFLSGGTDSMIRLWDVPTDAELDRVAAPTRRGKPYVRLPRKPSEPIRRLMAQPKAVAFSLDGKYAVSSTASMLPPKDMGGKKKLAPLAFPPPGFGMPDSESMLRLWQLDPASEVRRIQGAKGELTALALAPNGKQVIAGAGMMGDGIIRRWDLQSGKMLTQYSAENVILGLAYSPDGKRIAAAPGGVPLGGGIVAPEKHSAVLIWDVAGGRATRCLGHGGQVNSVAFSPKGGQLVSAAGKVVFGAPIPAVPGMADNTIRIWDAKSGARVAVLDGHPQGSTCALFTPDGKHILSGGADQSVRLWDAKTGKLVAEMKGQASSVLCLAISPDGKRFLSAGGGKDKAVLCWDLDTRQIIARLEMFGDVAGLAFSADGQQALAGGSMASEIRVWQLP